MASPKPAAQPTGNTAKCRYSALNQRVQTVTGAGTTEFVFNANGQWVSVWNGANNTQYRGEYYWCSKPVAFCDNGQTCFQHRDWNRRGRRLLFPLSLFPFAILYP